MTQVDRCGTIRGDRCADGEGPITMEEIIVRFDGDGAGIGGLTWGQQQVFAAMLELGSSLGLGGVVPVTDGRTVEDFAEELRFFMSRYGALRTLLRFDEDGGVTQEVFGSGETTLLVLEENDAGDAAEELLATWRARTFDYAHEWPIRMAVVRRDGVVTHAIVLICHAATDLGGILVMMKELAERDPVTGAALTPYAGMQPLDLVAAQLQPPARRTTEKAMRYWEEHLRAVPAARFAPPVDRGEPRFHRVIWSSRAMFLASERLAARLGVDGAAVLLAAFAAGFGRVTGITPFVAQAIIGNRFRPGLGGVVGAITQNGLCVLDVADLTAGEAIERARAASMTASKYGYYEPDARRRLLDAIERDRGETFDLACFYNDRRIQLPEAGAHEATDEELRAALAASAEVPVELPLPFFNEKLMVNIDDVPGTAQVTTEVDTRYLSLADLRAMLRQMEAFTVEAALDPTAPTGVAPYAGASR